MLMKDLELSEEAARAGLAEVREGCRKEVWARSRFNDTPGSFNLRRFRRLLSLFSSITRIDQVYIALQMQWQTTGLFETTDVLAALVIELCFRKRDSMGSRESKAQSSRPGTAA